MSSESVPVLWLSNSAGIGGSHTAYLHANPISLMIMNDKLPPFTNNLTYISISCLHSGLQVEPLETDLVPDAEQIAVYILNSSCLFIGVKLSTKSHTPKLPTFPRYCDVQDIRVAGNFIWSETCLKIVWPWSLDAFLCQRQQRQPGYINILRSSRALHKPSAIVAVDL